MRQPFDPQLFDLGEFEFDPYKVLLDAKLTLESMVEVHEKRVRKGLDVGDMNSKLSKMMDLYNCCTRLIGERETISNYMRIHKLNLLEAKEITNEYYDKKEQKIRVGAESIE